MRADEPAELRGQLVAYLRARGDVRSDRVASAFARVPRHVFVPDVAVSEVYADRSIAIKLENGVPISSSSQPAIMAEMLEMLQPGDGDRVLEIGAGSGYNAALLSELVGPEGFVETIDIDGELTTAARRHLDDAGYAHVRVECRDGALGDPASAPFDAVIASVGVERIPPAWIAQLREGGRLVAPLTIRSLQKVALFERTPQGLESRGLVDAGFMMLRGPSAGAESSVVALGEPTITLRVLRSHVHTIDVTALAEALRAQPSDTRLVRRATYEELWSGLALWLALRDDAFCHLTAQGASVQRGIVPNLSPGAGSLYGFATTFGLCDKTELVVFAPLGSRPLVVRRFGADTGALARLQSSLVAWDDAGRPGTAQLRITVAQDGTTQTAFGAT